MMGVSGPGRGLAGRHVTAAVRVDALGVFASVQLVVDDRGSRRDHVRRFADHSARRTR